jgi:phosphatidylethanolamine-binding protein (PEBP) family uncharacterized protein
VNPSIRCRLRVTCALLFAGAATAAGAHPWHRHRVEIQGEAVRVAETAEGPRQEQAPVDPRFVLVAAAKPVRAQPPDIAAAFRPFEQLEAITCRSDDRYFYVESNGIPDHPLMVGIRAWQQQVPLPQKYVGGNAWQIPLVPVPAADPATTKNRFLRGAIALAVNGIPIFNPLNNRGDDAFLAGELDDYGGHCGRADDYHYHLPPVHLEKQVGKGKPIAYALDGYPIYGFEEPDGSKVKNLDRLGGHEDAAGNYHYHATKVYPYLNGGFRGEVVEREGQVDPQPRAEPLRPALPPLQGARITGFASPAPNARRLTYEVGGRKGFVAYSIGTDGKVTFEFQDPAGRTSTESYTPRERGAGNGPPPRREPRPDGRPAPPPPGTRPPPRDGRGAAGESQGAGPAGSARQLVPAGAANLAVTSPAFKEGGPLPVEFTCDGAGLSPPLQWAAGPPGTKSYAVTLWHEAPDQVKSYWVVYGIPPTVRSLPKGSRSIGTTGLNDKRRAEYDPMCSKGPGVKTYHITVYALSAPPPLAAAEATRDALLDAISGSTLAAGTIRFTYERGGR